MEMIEMNKKAMRMMEEWDPFSIGSEFYEAEIADVVTQLQMFDHPSDLGKQIQSIYQLTFKQWIPLEHCVDISYKLLALKFEAKCII